MERLRKANFFEMNQGHHANDRDAEIWGRKKTSHSPFITVVSQRSPFVLTAICGMTADFSSGNYHKENFLHVAKMVTGA